MTIEKMEAFGNAWLAKDIEQIMVFFTMDCSYAPSLVKENGEIFHGKANVKKAVERVIDFDQTVEARLHNIFIEKSFGFWEWEYRSKEDQLVHGGDVFEFVGDKIRKKNAFRKLMIQ